MDPSGNSNAQIIHQWNEKLRTRFLAQVEDEEEHIRSFLFCFFKVQSFKMAGYQLALDYRTQFTTTSLTLANLDLVTNSGKSLTFLFVRDRNENYLILGIAVLQHLTRITKNIDLGAEFLYQASPMMPGGHIGMTSFVARYRGRRLFVSRKENEFSILILGLDWLTAAKVSPVGVFNLGYFHQKVNSPLQMGVEFEASLATKDTSATFTYQYDIIKANATFRGMVDTNGLVTAVIEKRLAPLPFTFLISSSLNHAKAAYRFGIGLLIG